MKRETIKVDRWRLVDAEGYAVRVGDLFRTARNVVRVTGGTPPQSSTSTGRITLLYQDGSTTEGYPQVIHCKWVRLDL